VRLPRITIERMLALVALAALDFWAYDFWAGRSQNLRLNLIVMTSQLMANVLAIGMILARRSRETRAEPGPGPGWLGFRAGGATALVLSILTLALLPYDSLGGYIQWLWRPVRGVSDDIEGLLETLPMPIATVTARLLCMAYASVQQFALALVGAWVGRRYKFTFSVERRRRPSSPPSSRTSPSCSPHEPSAGGRDMPVNLRLALATLVLCAPLALADDPKPAPKAEAKAAKKAKPKPEAKAEAPKPAGPPVSFLKDVAPVLVRNCIACHNQKKAEGKYIMTTFAGLKKGGVRGEGMTLEAGQPDESYFIELVRHDGEPRMPFKQDPLPSDKVALLERWVAEGAKYDGKAPTEDWTAVFRRAVPVVIPEAYPVPVPITALAFNPKGDELGSSGYHELNFWKLGDGKLGARVRPLPERIYDLAYSPDGKWLAVAGGDPGQFGTATLWKVEADGKLTFVRELVESTDCLFAIAFSPDGKTLAAAGADRAIRIWEVATGKELAVIEDHADWIFDLAYSPDGKRLASASRDKTGKVFDVAKKEAIATFPGHADAVYSVGFTRDGKLVATAGADAQIRVWNPDEDAKQSKTLGGFGGPIFKILFHPDGKTMVACSADKTVRIYENLSSKQTLSGHNDWVYSIALSGDGKTLASGSWDGEVRLWNLADFKPIKTLRAAPGLKPAGQTASK
jgi:hypothetical protein